MRSIFLEGPLASFFEKAGDMILTNFCFVIGCLPIITIGDAIGSMEYVFLKKREGSGVSVGKLFFSCFRENFRRSVIPTLLALAAAFLLYTDVRLFASDGLMPNTALTIIILAAGIMIFLVQTFLFAHLPVFRPKSFMDALTDSLILTVENLPSAVVMALLLAILVILTTRNVLFLLTGLVLWIVCGFGLIGFIDSYFLKRAFDRFRENAGKETA